MRASAIVRGSGRPIKLAALLALAGGCGEIDPPPFVASGCAEECAAPAPVFLWVGLDVTERVGGLDVTVLGYSQARSANAARQAASALQRTGLLTEIEGSGHTGLSIGPAPPWDLAPTGRLSDLITWSDGYEATAALSNDPFFEDYAALGWTSSWLDIEPWGHRKILLLFVGGENVPDPYWSFSWTPTDLATTFGAHPGIQHADLLTWRDRNARRVHPRPDLSHQKLMAPAQPHGRPLDALFWSLVYFPPSLSS